MFRKLALFFTICLVALPLFAVKIPIAPCYPDTINHLGTQLVDNYAWLKQRDNPMLHKQLKREASYCTAMMKQSKPLAKQISKEFISWIPQQETGPTYLENGYLYYTKSFASKDYPIHYRKLNKPGAAEELVMDENKLSHGKAFFALGVYSISPDTKILAYSVDYNGDEIYRLYLKNLHTAKVVDTGITGISDFVWQQDSKHAIITKQNTRLQTDKCYRLNTLSRAEELLLSEADPSFDLGIYTSGDKHTIFLLSSSKNSTECHFITCADTISAPKQIAKRSADHQYYPDSLGEELYIQSNLLGPDYSIFHCNLDKPDKANWEELVAAENGKPISSFILFLENLVMIRRESGFERIQILSRSDATLLDEISPQSATDISFWHNPDPDAAGCTYSMENELLPYAIYRYDFQSKTSQATYQSPLTKTYDPLKYISTTVRVTSHDGLSIPLSLIYKKGLDTGKPNPLWLSAYGAYGDTNDPYFSTSILSLLDRGVIYAVAHIRGGGEFGQEWYDGGRLHNKQNTFKDFVSCLDYVIDSKLSKPDLIIIEGGSAGGLLMGAVTNMAPGKMAVVIADVPFVDMLSTMLDDSLPLTLQEYEEWGNPNVAEDFNYMKQYSPYDNVRPATYPAMLISAAWYDTRVGYWEALKWANKLRANNLGQNPIVFRLQSHEGHTGSTDRMKSIRYYADTYAYALNVIGL